MFTKSILFALVLVLAFSSIYSVFAQSDVGDTMLKNPVKILALDDIMTPAITATLTGLSLTGASFLVNLTRNTGEDNDAKHVRLARKFFISAFFMFLICTVVLFIFDFVEILDERYTLSYTILDVIISHILFGIGAVYLVKAAHQLYTTYGK
jgi:uncharacterized membrane protein